MNTSYEYLSWRGRGRLMFNFLFSWWVLGSWHCWEHSESDEDWITWWSDNFVICRTFVSIQPFLMMDHRDSWITEGETLFEIRNEKPTISPNILQLMITIKYSASWWSWNIPHFEKVEKSSKTLCLKVKFLDIRDEMNENESDHTAAHWPRSAHSYRWPLRWRDESDEREERTARTSNVFRLGSDAVASISSILCVSAIQ